MKVAVVGAGLIGGSIALELAGKGLEVTLVDHGLPGAEASSAAGGMLAPQLENLGPGPNLDLGLLSRALWPEWAAEVERLSGLKVAYRPTGVLQLAFTAAEAQALEATVAWQREALLRADLLTVDAARALEPTLSDKVLAAAHFPDDHQVDNQACSGAVVAAAQKRGARLRAARVTAIARAGGRVTGVQTDHGLETADVVVLAAGAWSAGIEGSGLGAEQVKPIRGQMVELTPARHALKKILKSARGYLVPRADGRVLVGATMEDVGFDKRVTAEAVSRLLAMAIDTCPVLGTATVSATWAGLRPGTKDKLPILGPSATPGLVYATGHLRNGVLLAPVTARLVGQLILGQAPQLDLKHFLFDRISP
jgi:glycine oxidase